MNESYIPQVKRMLKDRLSYREIAEATGFTKETVRAFVAKHKLKTKAKAPALSRQQ